VAPSPLAGSSSTHTLVPHASLARTAQASVGGPYTLDGSTSIPLEVPRVSDAVPNTSPTLPQASHSSLSSLLRPFIQPAPGEHKPLLAGGTALAVAVLQARLSKRGCPSIPWFFLQFYAQRCQNIPSQVIQAQPLQFFFG
jgi:hypothetical protein